MKENSRPIRKTPYDTFGKDRGLCQFCGVTAVNGCCPRHQMNCQSCNGFGATTKEAYKLLYNSEQERRNHPPSPCCRECTADFNHTVGSHSDDRDNVPCTCLRGKCDFPNCFCHIPNEIPSPY